MLAGTVYYYDKDDKLIEKMDLYDYEDMNKETFFLYIENIQAVRVTIGALYHNHQRDEHIEEIYNKLT